MLKHQLKQVFLLHHLFKARQPHDAGGSIFLSDQIAEAKPFWLRWISQRFFGEGMESAPIKAACCRNRAASLVAAVSLTGANAEPVQYSFVISTPAAEPKPPFHGLDRVAPRTGEVNAW